MHVGLLSNPLTRRFFIGRDPKDAHRIYQRHRMMLDRCYNPNSRGFRWYGARGIKVCDAWRESLVQFVLDMGLPPFPGATIERKDNNGDYCPTNCIWATMKENIKNCRPFRASKYQMPLNGSSVSLLAYCRSTGKSYFKLRRALLAGASVESLCV